MINARLKNLKKSKPALHKVIAERFSKKKFAGLPFTLLIIVFIVNLLVLLDFVEDLINSKSFVVMDANTLKFFSSIRAAPVSRAFYLFTQAGTNITIIALTLSATILFLWKKKYHYIVALLIVVAGSGISVYAGKNTFHLLRPATGAYYLIKSFSFPSGHATYAVSLYGLFLYMLLRQLSTPAKRAAVLFAGVLFILLLGISRLYLGVHFLSDVLGGFMLGMLWLLSGIYIMEWHEYRLKHNKT